MNTILAFVPVLTSAILGAVYVSLGDGRPAVKILGAAVFAIAAYLQFFSSRPLTGLLVQVVLAVALAGWHRSHAH